MSEIVKQTEGSIQLAIYCYRASISVAPIILPNVFHFSWESDLLYVTDALYLHEFEVKLSRSDYYADKKKLYRHHSLKYQENCPKHFWYVCPDGIILPDSLPEYAGLMYVSDAGFIKIIKEAPRLRSKKINQKQMMFLLRKGVYRYWGYQRRDILHQRQREDGNNE